MSHKLLLFSVVRACNLHVTNLLWSDTFTGIASSKL